jgi:hypothetical protein
MLLVVVGLLVLVLVILVVVFLSVRSMRDAEEDGYQDRPAPRRSSRGSRDDDEDAGPRGRQPRSPARRGPAREGWQDDRSAVPPAGDEDDAGSPQRRVPALPQPRGYQHDQDEPRRAARSQPRQAAARLTGGDRGRGGKDWSDTDWGGVSDEQYWAELSSDKPLATTARSAQPAPADRAATAMTATDRAATTAMPAVAGPRSARFGGKAEPGEDVATAGAAPAADSWGPAEPRTFGDFPVPSQSRLAGRPGTGEGNATDPGLGSQAAWPGGADDSASTASWAAVGTGSAPAASWTPQDTSWAPQDSAGWPDSGESGNAPWTARDAAVVSGTNWADEPSAADWGEPGQSGPAWNGDRVTPAWNDDEQPARSWNAPEDPLTSPSFSASDGYAADGRAYRRSHDRARAQYESSPDVLGGAQPDYAGSHSNGNGYSAGWPASGDDYSRGSHDRLDPLPEPAAPAEGWHSAPVTSGDPRFYAEPAARSWDQAVPGYDDAPRHRRAGQSQDDGYSSQDYRDWQGTDAGYQQSAGYQPSHGQPHSNGYGQAYEQPSGSYETGYGSTTGYDFSGNGYSLPGRDSGPAVNGYGHDPGHGQHSGYDTGRWQ